MRSATRPSSACDAGAVGADNRAGAGAPQVRLSPPARSAASERQALSSAAEPEAVWCEPRSGFGLNELLGAVLRHRDHKIDQPAVRKNCAEHIVWVRSGEGEIV